MKQELDVVRDVYTTCFVALLNVRSDISKILLCWMGPLPATHRCKLQYKPMQSEGRSNKCTTTNTK